MPAQLRRNVVAGGVTYPAGTAETPELRARIPNPRAWTGASEAQEHRAVVEDGLLGSVPLIRGEELAALIESSVEAAFAKYFAAAELGVLEVVGPDGHDDEDGEPAAASAEPPRSGKGSGEDAWRGFAEGLGIEVPEDAGRDDIIALVDAHRAQQ